MPGWQDDAGFSQEGIEAASHAADGIYKHTNTGSVLMPCLEGALGSCCSWCFPVYVSIIVAVLTGAVYLSLGLCYIAGLWGGS